MWVRVWVWVWKCEGGGGAFLTRMRMTLLGSAAQRSAVQRRRNAT